MANKFRELKQLYGIPPHDLLANVFKDVCGMLGPDPDGEALDELINEMREKEGNNARW